MIVFGGSAVVASALSMTMPETLGTSLPDTVNEALRLGRYVLCCVLLDPTQFS